jgi:N-acetylmuramoyl-L-alanine amidase
MSIWNGLRHCKTACQWGQVVCLGVAAGILSLGSPLGPAGASLLRAAAATDKPAGGHAIDPSIFERGSCESFKATAGDRHKTVFLDAGHGGLDPGGVGETESGQTIYEADETLPVELDTMALLRANGFDVVVSRTRASTVARPRAGDISGGLFTVPGEHRDVADRDVCANMAKADILIGIYFDAGASSLNAGSVTGYDTARPFAAENLRLATLVQSDVLAAMNAQGWAIPDEGVVTDDLLGGPALSDAAEAYGHLLLLGPAEAGYFSTPSQMPGALIEPLFITDPYEGSLAASAPGQKVIATGLAQAVEQYFGPAHSESALHGKRERPKGQAVQKPASTATLSQPSL